MAEKAGSTEVGRGRRRRRHAFQGLRNALKDGFQVRCHGLSD
jgi:hypothetical protein